MVRYHIRVATGAWLFSGSHNRVQLWLVGERREAELKLQLWPARGQVSRDSGDPSPRPGLVAGGRGRVIARTPTGTSSSWDACA